MNELVGRHKGQSVTIVGRGPSLLELTTDDFPPGPVIVLNHAITRIRQLNLPNQTYTMQKDGCLAKPQPPETLIVSRSQSAQCWDRYRPRYMVDPRAFRLHTNCMSVTLAVAVAHLMGCTNARLLAFDSVKGDARTVVDDEPADTGRMGSYLHAAKQVKKYADQVRMPLAWI